VDWVNTFLNGFLKDLQDYIKKHHTTGLTWNPKGQDASKVSVGDAPASAPAAPAPASDVPPPPGPAPDFTYDEEPAKPKGGASALFAEINKKGETGVTTGLKHVTKDMKNKHNPPTSSVVPSKTETASASAPVKAQAAPAKPPKFALEGNKWSVEYQVGNRGIVIEPTEPKHTVYIYRCKQSTVQIKGKVNNIILGKLVLSFTSYPSPVFR
jgi:adenylyl cyclase-associated protein